MSQYQQIWQWPCCQYQPSRLNNWKLTRTSRPLSVALLDLIVWWLGETLHLLLLLTLQVYMQHNRLRWLLYDSSTRIYVIQIKSLDCISCRHAPASSMFYKMYVHHIGSITLWYIRAVSSTCCMLKKWTVGYPRQFTLQLVTMELLCTTCRTNFSYHYYIIHIPSKLASYFAPVQL